MHQLQPSRAFRTPSQTTSFRHYFRAAHHFSDDVPSGRHEQRCARVMCLQTSGTLRRRAQFGQSRASDTRLLACPRRAHVGVDRRAARERVARAQGRGRHGCGRTVPRPSRAELVRCARRVRALAHRFPDQGSTFYERSGAANPSPGETRSPPESEPPSLPVRSAATGRMLPTPGISPFLAWSSRASFRARQVAP